MQTESEVRSRPRAEHASLESFLANTLTPAQRQSFGFVSFSQWDFSLAALCDVAVEAQQKRSKVTLALWANDSPLRDTGWTTSRSIARILRSIPIDCAAESSLRSAGIEAEAFARPPINKWSPIALPAIASPINRTRIRELTYHGAPMGRAILQVHPNLNTPFAEEHVWPIRWVRKAAESYAWAYDQTQALIDERGITTLVVYNGRFLHDRAAADAAAMRGIPVLFYDSGGADTDYDLTLAETHDWADLQQRMKVMYDRWPDGDQDAIGASWFEDRIRHEDPELAVFVGAQTRGYMVDLPKKDLTVAYFGSSGDEMIELDLDWNEFFGSQENALLQLAGECRKRQNCTLIVRTHPHMRIKPSQDLESWTKAVNAAAPDLHLGPDSAADSYELVNQADIVFTYGSTVGVEAAFAGKPVVVMGPNAYTDLGCATPVTTTDEIARYLDEPPLANPAGALLYGLMMRRRGFNYTWVRRDDDGVPVLSGVRIDQASTLSQKVSDALNKARRWWLNN